MNFSVNKLIRWASAIFAGRASAILCLLVIHGILARVLTKPEFGLYLLLQTIAAGASMFAMAGINRLMPRDIRRHLANDSKDKASHVIIDGLLAFIPVSLFFGVALYVGLRWAASYTELPLTNELCLAVAIWVFISASHQLFSEILRAIFQVAKASLFAGPTGGPIVLGLCLLAYAAYLQSGSSLSLLRVVYIHVALAILALPFLMWLCYRELKAQGLPQNWDVDLGRLSRWFWAEAPSLTLAQGTMFATTNIDVWIASAALGPGSLALYLAPRRIVFFVSSILQVMNNVVTPVVPDLHAKSEMKQLQGILQRTATMAAIPSFAVALPLVLFPVWIVTSYLGADYRSSAIPLAILTFAQVFNVFTGSCGLTLLLTGHQKLVLLINLCCAVGMLLFVWFVGGRLDLLSLSVATACMIFFQYLSLWLVTRLRVGVWTHCSAGFIPDLLRMRNWSTR